MEKDDIVYAMGEFRTRIESLERTLDRLEICVNKLTSTVSDNKSVWQVLITVATVSAAVGAVVHKPFQLLLSLFQ